MKRHNFKGQGASHGNHKKHRAPGSIGACATPARVFKGMKMAGQMRQRAHHHAQPRGRRGRRRAQPAARQGRGPRPDGRPRVRAQRREGGREGVTRRSTMKTADRRRRRARVDAARRRLRHRAERRRSCTRSSPRSSPPPRAGTHSTKTRAEVARRWRQAVAPEGHRPRPAGLDPLAAVARRRRGPRPEAPRLRAAHAEEDDPPRAALARCPTAPPRARSSSSTTGRSTRPAPRTRSPRSARSVCAPPASADAGAARARPRPRTRRGSRSATSATACRSSCPRSSTRTTCSSTTGSCSRTATLEAVARPVSRRPSTARRESTPTPTRRRRREPRRTRERPATSSSRPVVSEKSYAAFDANVYTFVVAPDANKIEIQQGRRGDLRRDASPT